jgi:2-C-methyl-D-erythritol 4-phosphate cytidylyltransferase
MVTALIFAGGIGERMNSRAKPKQFLEIQGKPILVHTIEYFERHSEINNIVVVCLEEWIDDLMQMLERFYIKKVKWIVPGGNTGHESIYNGLKAISDISGLDDIVMIHDGVRPLISNDLISDNIQVTRLFGNAITVSNATESIGVVGDNEMIMEIPNRNSMRIIQAPQTFYFKDIWDAHRRALEEKHKAIDSAGLMKHYGYELHMVMGSPYNIKITSPSDYYIFRAIYDARENLQIFGL